MTSKTTDIKQIHKLIDRYFEATSTDSEERELRSILASTPLSSGKINEARAVMGFFAVSRQSATPKRGSRNQWIRSAAAVAAAAICGVGLLTYSAVDRTKNQCVAYIGTTEITDSHKVMAMMHSDLAQIAEASQSVDNEVAAQLSTLFNSSLQ